MAHSVLITQKPFSNSNVFWGGDGFRCRAAFLVMLGWIFLWHPGFQSHQRYDPSIENKAFSRSYWSIFHHISSEFWGEVSTVSTTLRVWSFKHKIGSWLCLLISYSVFRVLRACWNTELYLLRFYNRLQKVTKNGNGNGWPRNFLTSIQHNKTRVYKTKNI